MAKKKATFISSTEHALIGRSGSPTETVEPGGRVSYDENADSHKFLRERIEAGDPAYAHLSIVEVDLDKEASQEEEKQEMLAKASEIAADVRNEEAQAAADKIQEGQDLQEQAREEGQPAVNAGTDYPAQDEEAMRISEQAGAGQRATTSEDVVEPKSTGRKRSSSSKG